MFLSNAPRTPARLPEYIDGIAGFVKQDGRHAQKVQPGGNEPGMSNAHLHPRLQLALIPGFPGFRRYSGGEHFDANALTAQDVLQPLGDVALLRVDRENLHPPPLAKLGLDLFHQPALLRIDELLIQVRRLRNHKALALAGFWIRRVTVKRSEEHTSELQSLRHLVCRLLLEKK